MIRNHLQSSPVQDNSSISEIEKRAKEFLAQGKFRKARDDFKVLTKSNKPLYLPFLIEANVGLMREMLSKGLHSEAGQVRAYLKGIVSPEEWKGIELSFACASGAANSDAASDAFGLLLSCRDANDAQRRRLADNIILGWTPKTVSQASGAERLVQDALAVQKGLQSVSTRDFSGALDAVRPVAHDSAFSHWKLFIKGLAAFHAGEFAKANRFFESIPANTAPSGGSRPYVYLGSLSDHAAGANKSSDAEIKAVLSLLGIANVMETLVEADRRWSRHRHADAFKLLRSQIKDFPCEGNHWKGVLSDFCFHSLFHMHYDEGDRLMDCFDDIQRDHRGVSDVESMLLARISCLFDGHRNEPETTLGEWEEYIHLHGKLHGKDPEWSSAAHLWLGLFFAQVRQEPISPFGFLFRSNNRRGRMYSEDLALKLMEKSIKLDPANLNAHLALCRTLKTLKRKSDLNRWRDIMTARFPDEKSVLVEAGCGCIDRGTYVRGIEYLERARHLDRLDSAIPNHLMEARLCQARQYMEKGKSEKARQTLDGSEELLVDAPGNYVRSRWVFHVQRALLEVRGGDGDRMRSDLNLACQHSPFPAAVFFFAETFAVKMNDGNPYKVSPDWRDELSRSFTVSQACVLLEILCFRRENDSRGGMSFVMSNQLEPFIKKLLPSIETRTDRVRLIELMEGFSPLEAIREQLIVAGHKKDPEDPLFQIYDYLRHERRAPLDERFSVLDKMLALAQRRQDEKAVRLIQKEIQTIPMQHRDRRSNAPAPPPADGGPFDIDDDGEFDDEEVDDDPHSPFSMPPDLDVEDLFDEYEKMNESLPVSMRLPELQDKQEVFSIMTGLAFLGMVPEEELNAAVASAPAMISKELALQMANAIRYWRRTGQFRNMTNPALKESQRENRSKPAHKPKKMTEPDPNQMDLF